MLNNYEFQRYILAIAANAGLSVVWTDGGVPCADDKHVYIPRGKSTDTTEDWKERLYYAIHEAGGHQMYTDMDPRKEYNQVNARDSLLGYIHNALEDVRIETINALDYEGDRVLCDEMQTKHWTKVLASASENPTAPAIQAAGPLMEFMLHQFEPIYPSSFACQGQLDKFLGTEAKGKLDKLLRGDYGAELDKCCTIRDKVAGTKATWELSKRIFREVYEEDPDEHMKEQQEKKKKEGKGEGEGDKDGKGKGASKSDKDSGKGKEDAKGDDKKGAPDESDSIVDIDYSDLLNHHHGVDPKNRRGERVNYDVYKTGGAYTPVTPDMFHTMDYTSGKSEGPLDPSTFTRGDYRRELKLAREYNEGFSNMVRQKLQVRDKSRYEYAKKRGQLHRPALHRVLVKDAPGYNERVFRKRIDSDTLNTAITVLVDSSGSMSGDKYEHACAAACMLNDSLGNTLHIPLEIVGFTEHGPTPVNFVHRSHGTRLLSKDQLIDRLEQAGAHLANNADGDSVVWAYHRLRQRKEKRKLLIVISDGSPAYSNTRGDIVKYTKDVVQEIERSPVEVYGIGVMSSSVKMFYKDHCVIKSPSELESTLLNLIDRKVT